MRDAKTAICAACMFLLSAAAMPVGAQTLHIPFGQVDYLIPASAGDMTFSGSMLTVLGKDYDLAAADTLYVDDSAVSAASVAVYYNGTTASVSVSGDIARYMTVSVNGAHVAVAQSEEVTEEISYTLSGNAANGSFRMDGDYKCTVVMSNLNLTNADSAAVNIHNGKRINLVIEGSNTLTDAAGGAQKACLVIKGHPELTGAGTLTVTGKTGHAVKAREYMLLKQSFTGSVIVPAAAGDGLHVGQYLEVRGGNITVQSADDDGIQVEYKTDDNGNVISDEENTGAMLLEGGTINVTVSAKGAKGIKTDGPFTVNEAYGTPVVRVTNSGSNNSSSSGGSWWGGSSSSGGGAKGIKAEGAITINGGNIYAYAANHEAVESKSTITVNGGTLFAQSSDDAVNAASHLTVNGGRICAWSTGNDGLDANGNCYIKGGIVYAIGTSSPEMAVDANTEAGYKLYVSGGTLVAVGSLERGASLTQNCYSSSSWTKGAWYALYNNGEQALVFKTPATAGSSGGGGGGRPGGGGGSLALIVSTSGTTTLKSAVTISGGNTFFEGMAAEDATVSGGSSVSLSAYSASSGGGRW